MTRPTTPPTPVHTGPLLDELRQLEAELHHPGIPCSRSRLEQLLHPDFHEVGRSGARYDRATVLNHLAAQTSSPNVEPTDHAVHRLADDCALLTYRSTQRAADGMAFHTAWRSSVWRCCAQQGWQLFYHQGTATDSDR